MRPARLWSSPQLLTRGFLSPRSAARPSPQAFRGFFTSSQLLHSSSKQRALFSLRCHGSAFARRLRSLRWKSDKATPSQKPDPMPNLGSPEPAPSLSQRLKKLSREYGWSAFGVYMVLTALDFPFCFLAVRALGTDRIAHYEHIVVESVMSVARIPFPNLGKKTGAQTPSAGGDGVGVAVGEEEDLGIADDIEDAEARNRGDGASIWTQLALAYAIHKSFIFVRVPLTAAITPKVVKTLRGWGWNIGKRKPQST